MFNTIKKASALMLAAVTIVSCGKKDEQPASSTQTDNTATQAQQIVTIYSGRKKQLSDPLYKMFEMETGIKIAVKEGKTTTLANLIIEEGEKSNADLFFAQDSSNLGALSAAGLLQTLPETITAQVDSLYRGPKSDWVGTSGRARTLVYNTDLLTPDDLPKSILELTDAKWQSKVGWAPKNGSFQSHTTAMRKVLGEEKTKEWLSGMVTNDAKDYPKNTPIVAAVARGEISCGLVNHYYLLQKKASSTEPVPAENHFFDNGDAGLMVNVSGIALLKSSQKSEAALKFIDFLLSEKAQQFFVSENFEYPMTGKIKAAAGLKSLAEIKPPAIDLGDLDGIKETVEILKETKALK